MQSTRLEADAPLICAGRLFSSPGTTPRAITDNGRSKLTMLRQDNTTNRGKVDEERKTGWDFNTGEEINLKCALFYDP